MGILNIGATTMIRERFDRHATGALTATEQYHRDAVWYRLSAGGVGLPSSIIAVASYVVSQTGTTLQKTIEGMQKNGSRIYDQVMAIDAKLNENGASLRACFENGRQSNPACDAFRSLQQLADHSHEALNNARDFQVFRLCCNLGFGDGTHGVSCGAGSTLLLGSFLLVSAWLVATWLPYVDGPRHATMPRLWFITACSISVVAFVGFVNALLLT